MVRHGLVQMVGRKVRRGFGPPYGLAVLGTFAVLCCPPETAEGATATTTMNVTATVQATCTISTSAMAFGTYTGVVLNSTATVTVTCTNTTPYTVGLNAGTGTSPTATVTTRHMTGPSSAQLNYALTQDSGHATNWGNTGGTDTPASANGNGSAVNLTVYGQIAAGQYVTPGSYSDTVTATVNF